MSIRGIATGWFVVFAAVVLMAGCGGHTEGDDNGPAGAHADETIEHSEGDGHDHAAEGEHGLAEGDGHDHSEDEGHDHAEGDGHDHAAEGGEPIAIPAAVRSNLGLSLVTVEQRRIASTLRVPGRFEYQPNARREYRATLPGRVELMARQFERVEAGAVLYRLDSPAWREMQQQIAASEASIRRLETRLATFDPLQAAHDRHEQSLDESIAVWEERVGQLESIRTAGGGRVEQLTEARAALATARAELADVQETKAELDAARAEALADLDSARSGLNYLFDSAAAVVGMPRATLVATVRTDHGEEPGWAAIDMIEVHATEPGVVEALAASSGSWLDEGAEVVSVVRPDLLRFHASGLQSDLGVLRDGLTAAIVPPTPTAAGRAIPLQDVMRGRLMLGLAGDAEDRTIELYVTPESLRPWARPGVTAQLEIVTDESEGMVAAIPLAAVQRDGLVPVIFRVDPDHPDEAVRLEAELGADDGRWVEVRGGLRAGDRVVLDGAFQLMLATSGSMQQGGHFHSDGTFHEGED